MTLEHVDTFIAFAMVMLGVSLIITILTQMVSSFLGLRGTDLRWGVTELLKMVQPARADRAEHIRAEHIADWILTHPLISDSSLSKWGHRGAVPADYPDGCPGSRAWLWLHRRCWLPNRWKLASAVRVEELVGLLQKYGNAQGNQVEQDMHQIAQAATGAGPEVQALAAQVSNLLAALPAIPAGGAGGPALQIDQLIQKLPSTAEATFADMKSWFNAAMDRASQRFVMHIRRWTASSARRRIPP